MLTNQILYPKKELDKDFVAGHCAKTVLTLNKPIYVGFCILKLSKLSMYQCHCGFFLRHFNARYLFTDTDSCLVYEIKISTCLISVDIQKVVFITVIQIEKH